MDLRDIMRQGQTIESYTRERYFSFAIYMKLIVMSFNYVNLDINF